MLKKAFTSLIIISFFFTGSFAQKSDQVTLKNGTIIRGTVVKMVPEGNVTINDLAGNTWVFKMEEIEQIEEVENPGLNNFWETSPGFINMTTIGFLAGSQNSEYIAPFSMQTSLGYLTNSGLYSGLLVGLEFLNVNHIPVMLDFQYPLWSGNAMPVVIVRGGYTIPSKFENDYYGTLYKYSGGITGAIGMGLKIRSMESFAWDISLLYRYMQINYTEDYEWQSYQNSYKDVYNRLEIRVGFYLGTH